jgi:hypothetical protein
MSRVAADRPVWTKLDQEWTTPHDRSRSDLALAEALEGEAADFSVGDLVLVSAGTRHNFRTVGEAAMKIITAYSPPHHPVGTIHATKADAAH